MDSGDKDMESLRKRFESMKWNDLRKTASKNHLKVFRVSKEALINQLVEKFVEDDVMEEDKDEVSGSTETTEHPDDPVLKDENKPPLDYESDAKSDATFTVEGSDEQKLDDETEIISGTQSKGHKRQNIKDYFSKKHEEVNKKQEDLKTMVSRRRERHRSLTRGCPDRIAALSLPKCAGFEKPKHPSVLNFDFGQNSIADLPKVQKTVNAKLPHTSPSSKSIGEMKESAKTLSRDRILTNCGNIISTPKIADHFKAKETKSFKLRRSSSLGRISNRINHDPFAYVDTTIMSDAEHAEYLKNIGRSRQV